MISEFLSLTKIRFLNRTGAAQVGVSATLYFAWILDLEPSGLIILIEIPLDS